MEFKYGYKSYSMILGCSDISSLHFQVVIMKENWNLTFLKWVNMSL